MTKLSGAAAIAFILLLTAGVSIPVLAPAADETPATARAQADESAPPPVRLDAKERKITIDAQVCLRSAALEFVLCKRGTKEHESIMSTIAEPSHIHAALLAMGLTPGKPAMWETDPLTEKGRTIPPRGAGLKITLHWTDKDGTRHQANPADWLKPATGAEEDRQESREIRMPHEWIFVGSEVLPDGRYWADLNGEIISVANFASSVIDVPFESTSDNQLLQFSTNTEAIPPDGTEVQIVIKPVKGAKKAPHARQTIEIDRNGRLSVQGQNVSWKQISNWAEKYIAAHSRGMVHIRARPDALSHDVRHLKDELLLGGVREMEVEHLAAEPPPLPRTPAQAKAEIRRFEEQLANPQDYLEDPVVKVKNRLGQVKFRLREHTRLEGLWDEYSASLRQLLVEYESSSPREADNDDSPSE